MDAWELYIKLIKIAGYDYPYSDIAKEISEKRGVTITRQAIWYECNGKHTSQMIREFIANKLKMKVEDIFPVKTSKRDAA